jgi:hypothetical protein
MDHRQKPTQTTKIPRLLCAFEVPPFRHAPPPLDAAVT